MPVLVHLNGPPGVGKSTLSALRADRNPGTLNLDVDALHLLIGGWRDPRTDTWRLVWPLVHAMTAAHLDGGHDVVLPQYHARPDEVAVLEDLARAHGAAFREVVLLADRDTTVARFDRRGRETDDPWIRHHHGLLGADRLGTMHDDLLALVGLLPDAVVVPSAEGAVEETYALLAAALRA